MGKRKRSDKDSDEIVRKVMKKVKRLVKTRKRIVSSSSEDSSPEQNTFTSEPLPCQNSDVHVGDQEVEDEIPTETPLSDELDPEILNLLGSDLSQVKSFGENLHKDLATRWKYILTNGLSKEEKKEIMQQYLPAENCSFMKAPLLNPEIKTALLDINVKKDSYAEQKQNQMASCISAVGKALNIALTQTEFVPQEMVKILSDAGRILCDTHHRESLSRRFSILNTISKHKREILKNTKIDDYLFGSNLSEHLKSSKAISTSASELRANSIRSTQSRPTPTTSARNPGTLNTRGAPRTPVADSRVFPTQYRRPLPPVASHPPAPTSREYRRAPPPAAPRSRTRPYPQQSRQR